MKHSTWSKRLSHQGTDSCYLSSEWPSKDRDGTCPEFARLTHMRVISPDSCMPRYDHTATTSQHSHSFCTAQQGSTALRGGQVLAAGNGGKRGLYGHTL